MHYALSLLNLGEEEECKNLLEEGKITLDCMTDVVDPRVYGIFYWVSSKYRKFRLEFAEEFRNGLLHLSYRSLDYVPESLKMNAAFELFLAALLGDDIYNFGELLAHPIMKSLQGTEKEWIYLIVEAFHAGDVDLYQELCRVHATSWNSQPHLGQNKKKLLEKINILCLMDIIVSWPSEDRSIPLASIAERTKLAVDDVELLIKKCLSVHLIEGSIDQVDRTVHVSWFQPRVLGIPDHGIAQ